MSGCYLEKLRALKSEKGAVEEPTKLTEPCFVGFVSTQSVVFSNFAARYSRTMAALEADCPDLVPTRSRPLAGWLRQALSRQARSAREEAEVMRPGSL